MKSSLATTSDAGADTDAALRRQAVFATLFDLIANVNRGPDFLASAVRRAREYREEVQSVQTASVDANPYFRSPEFRTKTIGQFIGESAARAYLHTDSYRRLLGAPEAPPSP